MTQAAALATCKALSPPGAWSLASIVDANTAAAVNYPGGCGGTLALTTAYWIGLVDATPGQRAIGVTNRGYAGWAWTSREMSEVPM